MFLLVKAQSSFHQPLHFLPKRDFKYSKKVIFQSFQRELDKKEKKKFSESICAVIFLCCFRDMPAVVGIMDLSIVTLDHRMLIELIAIFRFPQTRSSSLYSVVCIASVCFFCA